MRTYEIPEYGITVTVSTSTRGTIVSELSKELTTDEGDLEGKASADALEALILAHACAGIDVSLDSYVHGLRTAVEAIANNL
jgi:pyridoxine 5'-phosphate synthase PdxJ